MINRKYIQIITIICIPFLRHFNTAEAVCEFWDE